MKFFQRERERERGRGRGREREGERGGERGERERERERGREREKEGGQLAFGQDCSVLFASYCSFASCNHLWLMQFTPDCSFSCFWP